MRVIDVEIKDCRRKRARKPELRLLCPFRLEYAGCALKQDSDDCQIRHCDCYISFQPEVEMKIPDDCPLRQNEVLVRIKK